MQIWSHPHADWLQALPRLGHVGGLEAVRLSPEAPHARAAVDPARHQTVIAPVLQSRRVHDSREVHHPKLKGVNMSRSWFVCSHMRIIACCTRSGCASTKEGGEGCGPHPSKQSVRPGILQCRRKVVRTIRSRDPKYLHGVQPWSYSDLPLQMLRLLWSFLYVMKYLLMKV